MPIVVRNAARVELIPELREAILGMYVHYGREGAYIRNYKYKSGVAYLPLNRRKLDQVALITGKSIVDERSAGSNLSTPFLLNPAFTFRDHQGEPALEMLKYIRRYQYGVLQAGCGCGKTVVMTWVAGQLHSKILVMVDMGSLQSQWKEAFQIVWQKEACIINRGTLVFPEVCIVTFQLLHANPLLLDRISKEFGVILLDEFHSTAAETRREVLFKLNSKYRIGCTATLMKKNFSTEVLTDMVDDVSVVMVDEEELQAEVRFLPTGYMFAYNTPDMWGKIISALGKDAVRNFEIAKVVAVNCKLGRKVLVVGVTVASLKIIHAILLKVPECRPVMYAGSTTLKQDQALKVAVANGKTNVVLTVKKCEKGWDVASLDCLVNAKPANNEAGLVQLIGRILRALPGKPRPIVYDMLDGGSLAATFAKNREKWYKKMGHTIVREG